MTARTAVEKADEILEAAVKAEYVAPKVFDSPTTKTYGGKPRSRVTTGQRKQSDIEKAAEVVNNYVTTCGVPLDGRTHVIFQEYEGRLAKVKDFDPEVQEAIVTLLTAAHEALGDLIERVRP